MTLKDDNAPEMLADVLDDLARKHDARLSATGPTEPDGSADEEEQAEEELKPKVILDTYKPTPVAELDQHVNRLLKIRTLDGKQHHAYLSIVDQETLVLTQELVGGSATFRVPIAQIEEVRVLH